MYDYDNISRTISRDKISDGPNNLWRYDDLLPSSREKAVNIGAGMTPLLKANNLDHVYISMDTLMLLLLATAGLLTPLKDWCVKEKFMGAAPVT